MPIYNLMEDAATAEICRTQVWQWVRHGACLNDGRPVTSEMARTVTHQTVEALRSKLPEASLSLAGRLFEDMMTCEEFPEFLTLAAYQALD